MSLQQTFPPAGIALITGGASGFGLEAACRFLDEGFKVCIVDVQQDNLDTACADLKRRAAGADDHVLCHRLDVSDEVAVADLAGVIQQTWPNTHISFVFNNAGVYTGSKLLDAAAKDWEFMMRVNVIGVANVIKTFVPLIMAQTNGSGLPCRFVNTSSVAGLLALHGGPYLASKMAVTAMTEGLHFEMQGTYGEAYTDSMTVHSLHPFAASTGIWFADRNRPKEVADAQTSSQAEKDRAKGEARNDLVRQGYL